MRVCTVYQGHETCLYIPLFFALTQYTDKRLFGKMSFQSPWGCRDCLVFNNRSLSHLRKTRYSVHADVSNRDRGLLNFGLNLHLHPNLAYWLILFQHRIKCKYQYPKKCCSSEPSSKIITEDFLGFYNHYKMSAHVCVCVCVCVPTKAIKPVHRCSITAACTVTGAFLWVSRF